MEAGAVHQTVCMHASACDLYVRTYVHLKVHATLQCIVLLSVNVHTYIRMRQLLIN